MVGCRNYEDFPITLTVTAAQTEVVVEGIKVADKDYDGQPIVPDITGVNVYQKLQPEKNVTAHFPNSFATYTYYRNSVNDNNLVTDENGVACAPRDAGKYWLQITLASADPSGDLQYGEYDERHYGRPVDIEFEIRPAEGVGSVTMGDWTYNAEGTGNDPVPGSATNGTAHVTYEYEGIAYEAYEEEPAGDHYGPTNERPTNVGKYTVKAIFAPFPSRYNDPDYPNYKKVESALCSFTINKAQPTADVPTGSTAIYGWQLAKVRLTNPEDNTPGTWAWDEKDGEGPSAIPVGDAGGEVFLRHLYPGRYMQLRARDG